MNAIDVGKTIRLNRFFRDGRIFLVPVDDSFISGPEGGLSDMNGLLSCIDSSEATGIMLTYGSYIRNFEVIKRKPCILNVSGSTTRSNHTHKVKIQNVLTALKSGFSGVTYHINLSSGFEGEMLKDAAEVGIACQELSMPYMIICYPRTEQADGKDNNYTSADIGEYTKLVKHCVRVAVELGADIIKTHYTGSVDSFKEVVAAAEGVPVLISGASMIDVDALKEKVSGAMIAGATGVCIGRNVFNSTDPRERISTIASLIWK